MHVENSTTGVTNVTPVHSCGGTRKSHTRPNSLDALKKKLTEQWDKITQRVIRHSKSILQAFAAIKLSMLRYRLHRNECKLVTRSCAYASNLVTRSCAYASNLVTRSWCLKYAHFIITSYISINIIR